MSEDQALPKSDGELRTLKLLSTMLFVVAAALGFWFAWWLRGNIAQGTVDGLREQIKARDDHVTTATAQVASARAQADDQSNRLQSALHDIEMLKTQLQHAHTDGAVIDVTSSLTENIERAYEANRAVSGIIRAIDFSTPPWKAPG